MTARAEVLKLARLLHVEPERLEFLEQAEPRDLAKVREQATDALYDGDAARLRGIADASRHLPIGLVATIGQKVFGPLLCARIAGLLEPARAAQMAGHFKPGFLAELAAEMDPRRASDVIARIPVEMSADVARQMARNGEHVAMGRFVGHLSDPALAACAAVLSDADLLRIGYTMESPQRMDAIVASLDDSRLEGIARASLDEDLVDEALALVGHLRKRQRKRLVEGLRAHAGEIPAGRRDQVLAAIPELAG